MQFRNALRCVSILTVLALAFATAAAAQQFEILHARYGSEHRNIDVTQQLRRLAGVNATFRLSWRTFGDPAQGQAKTLRIFARGPRARTGFLSIGTTISSMVLYSRAGAAGVGGIVLGTLAGTLPGGVSVTRAFDLLKAGLQLAITVCRFSAPNTAPEDSKCTSPVDYKA